VTNTEGEEARLARDRRQDKKPTALLSLAYLPCLLLVRSCKAKPSIWAQPTFFADFASISPSLAISPKVR
jgi:hypothetical protein